jgi:hypothetical protein
MFLLLEMFYYTRIIINCNGRRLLYIEGIWDPMIDFDSGIILVHLPLIGPAGLAVGIRAMGDQG